MKLKSNEPVNMGGELLTNVITLFKYYKNLGDKTFEQLSDRDLFWPPSEDGNSIAIIVNHLSGNMKSRWTDFLSSDGEKEWRNRDREFEDIIKTKGELIQIWNEGWHVLFSTLDGLTNNDLGKTILIRNQKHTVIEAIHRQMMHYASHIGQIVLIGKMKRGTDWETLSIAKGTSKEFNRSKTSKGEHGGHFTAEFMNDES